MVTATLAVIDSDNRYKTWKEIVTLASKPRRWWANVLKNYLSLEEHPGFFYARGKGEVRGVKIERVNMEQRLLGDT